MKTVKEVSKITGISIRTLRYYDEIGLLKPTKVSEAGYRLYDNRALEKLQEILFYRELEFPLADIKAILEKPNYNKQEALAIQKSLLEHKRNRLNGIIELIDDVMEGVNTMSFEAFSDEDVKRIIDHSLELRSPEDIEAIIEKFGSLEAFRSFVHESYKNEEQTAELIKIYGSKDKAVNASLASTGNTEEIRQFQEETDRIYRQFARAMQTGDSGLAMKCVEQLAESNKKMFRLDNSRYLLLKMADDYLNHGLLTEATDKQYGEGVTQYIGHAIQNYYGI